MAESDSASGSDHGVIMRVFLHVVPLNAGQACGAFDYQRNPKCGRPILVIILVATNLNSASTHI